MGIQLAKAFVTVRADASKLKGDLRNVQRTTREGIAKAVAASRAASATGRSSRLSDSPAKQKELLALLNQRRIAVKQASAEEIAASNRLAALNKRRHKAEIALIQRKANLARKAEAARIAAAQKIARINRGIGVAALVAAGVALRAMKGAIEGIIKAAGNFEQVNVAFETMFGNARLAQIKLEQLQDFATRTPFTLPGVEAAARSLIAVGFTAKELLPTLKTLGDISAGLGRGEEGLRRLILNLGQVKAQAKLTGRELRDFAILGVPILESLADITGKSKAEIQALTQAGEISSELVVQAFENMTKEGGRFNNLMEKMNKTTFGLFSNLKDEITLVQRELGSGLIPVMKEALQVSIKLSKSIRELVQANKGAAAGAVLGAGAALALATAYLALAGAAAFAGISIGALLVLIAPFAAAAALIAIIGVSFGIVAGSIIEATSAGNGFKVGTEAWTNKLAEANIELKKGAKNLKDFSEEGSKASQNLGGFINSLRKIVDIGETRKGINQLIGQGKGVTGLNELVANVKKANKELGPIVSDMLQDLRRLTLFRVGSGPTKLELSETGTLAIERLEKQFGESRFSDNVLAAFEKQIRSGAIGLLKKSFTDSTEALDEFLKKAKELTDPVSDLVKMRDELLANKKVLEAMAAAPKGTFPELEKDLPDLIRKTGEAIKFTADEIRKMTGFTSAMKKLNEELSILKGTETELSLKAKEFKQGGISQKEIDEFKRKSKLRDKLKQDEKDAEKKKREGEAERKRVANRIKSITKKVATPFETFRNSIKEFRTLNLDPATFARASREALKTASTDILAKRDALGPKPLLEDGRSGFAEFGRKIQDSLIARSAEDRDKKRNELLQKQLAANEGILTELQKNPPAGGGLGP